MAFLGTKQLCLLLKSGDVIKPFDSGRIKNGAYELSLGEQVFITSDNPKAVKTLNEKQDINIEPGQFALLLTEETVKIPANRIAFISIRAKLKWKGLVNVSGFHVDPSFNGKLLFSVYNAGPYNIVLQRGEKYFPIWFAELVNNENQDYSGSHNGQGKIPVEAIEPLSQGDLVSPNILSKKIDDLKTEYERRIGLIEKEQTAKDYLVKTAVGLGIIILVKFLFDWSSYDNGIKKGNDLKKEQLTLDSLLNQSLLKKKSLLIEIDSLEKIKMTSDTTPKN